MIHIGGDDMQRPNLRRRYPEHVPVADEDHGGVAMAVAPAPVTRRLHQKRDLALRQVLARAALLVAHPPRRDCPIYNGRGPLPCVA